MKKIILLLLSFFPFLLCSADRAGSFSLVRTEINGAGGEYDYDACSLEIFSQGLADLVTLVKNDSRFSAKAKGFTREDREYIWNVWQSFQDYVYAIDSIRHYYSNFLLEKNKEDKRRSFALHYSAFISQYGAALDFINIIEKNETLVRLLDDSVPELGIAQNSYLSLKKHFLNPNYAITLVMLNVVANTGIKLKDKELEQYLQTQHNRIVNLGVKKDISLTMANAFDVMKNASETLVFPVQSRFAEWAGDTKVNRLNTSLITPSQIAKTIMPVVQPGDIIVERREWYISNVGLPGFWPHGAFFLGSAAELSAYFDSDPDTTLWAKSLGSEGAFSDLLKMKYPNAWKDYITADHLNHPYRLIEAMSEGVVFTSIEHSADCDSLAVLRPQLSVKEKAVAIYKAFSYFGRNYDYNFDFLSDSTIVCTELLVKSFEKSKYSKGIAFKGSTVIGKKVVSANDMVRDYAENKVNNQLELVLYLEGYEKGKKAVVADSKAFCKSWKYPKWNVWTQKKPVKTAK